MVNISLKEHVLRLTEGFQIVLGSSSTFRKKVMEETGIPFVIVTADIDEKLTRTIKPELTSLLISEAKMTAVKAKVTKPSIIITCDQVIVCGGNVLEKPESVESLEQWYRLYTEKALSYTNGLTVHNTKNGKTCCESETSMAFFHSTPSRSFIEEQIKQGDILTCCGGVV